jgi:hypothetical protein
VYPIWIIKPPLIVGGAANQVLRHSCFQRAWSGPFLLTARQSRRSRTGESPARPARAPGAVSERIAGGLIIVFWQPHHKGLSASPCHLGTSVADDSRGRDCAKSLLGVQISIPGSDSLPSDEEVAAFLHRLRPIYLNNESTNFSRMCSLVSHNLRDSTITEYIRRLKQCYDGRDSQELFQITVAGKVVNSEEFFGHYVNAFEYHRNKARQQHIDAIAQHFPMEAQKRIFVLLLWIRLDAINGLAWFLQKCLDGEDGMPITLQVS